MKKEDFIKLGLDEETATKCANASQEELKGFIPKSRFDDVNELKKRLENDVKERDAQLETLKNSTADVETLKGQIQKLQDDNKAKDEQHAKEIRQLRIDTAVETAIKDANGKNVKAIRALLNLDGVELEEDGTIKGLAEQMKTLIESEDSSFLFDTNKTQKTQVKGAKVGESGKDDREGKVDISKMTYSELASYLEQNPDAKID